MKKLISYILFIALAINVFAINVVAEGEPTITNDNIEIVYDEDSQGHPDNDGYVRIKITSMAERDLMIKIVNIEENKVVYLDVVSASENNVTKEVDGVSTTEKVTELQFLKKTIGFEEFTLILSDGEYAVEEKLDVVKHTKRDPVPPGPTPPKDPEDDGWTNGKNKPTSEGWEESELAHIDPLNEKKVEASSNVASIAQGVAFITTTTKATDDYAMNWESTKNTIAVSVETMMANIGSKKISSSAYTNKLILKESSISDYDLKKYTDNEKALKDVINKNNINLNRELIKEYIVNTSFSVSKAANITVYKGYIEKLEKAGIETLTINDKNFRVSYSLADLKAMIGEEEFTSFDINTASVANSTTKKLTVNFATDNTKSVKISFPGLKGETKYMAIVDENGNPVGGRYNPATGALEAKISESGEFRVISNEKDFEDIKHLSEEMQESIKILAAKGIIEGTSEKEFSPEDSISRAEVAALLLRVLSQVDPNADGHFSDVKKADWFYGTAGSAKNYGMIVGFEDNTFRGNATIAKDQILTIASRVLQKEMKYIVPENPGEWLKFKDSSTIADWAEKDIALTSMANIITRTADNTIHANENMTRGDAALIIMRLFYKVW